MWQTLRDLIPMTRQQKNKLFDHLAAVTRALVYGTGMTALIQGTLVGISFLIVGPALRTGVRRYRSPGGSIAFWRHGAHMDSGRDRARRARSWGATLFMLIWGGLLVSLVDNVVATDARRRSAHP
jgi:hypothetical protein